MEPPAAAVAHEHESSKRTRYVDEDEQCSDQKRRKMMTGDGLPTLPTAGCVAPCANEEGTLGDAALDEEVMSFDSSDVLSLSSQQGIQQDGTEKIPNDDATGLPTATKIPMYEFKPCPCLVGCVKCAVELGRKGKDDARRYDGSAVATRCSSTDLLRSSTLPQQADNAVPPRGDNVEMEQQFDPSSVWNLTPAEQKQLLETDIRLHEAAAKRKMTAATSLLHGDDMLDMGPGAAPSAEIDLSKVTYTNYDLNPPYYATSDYSYLSGEQYPVYVPSNQLIAQPSSSNVHPTPSISRSPTAGLECALSGSSVTSLAQVPTPDNDATMLSLVPLSGWYGGASIGEVIAEFEMCGCTFQPNAIYVPSLRPTVHSCCNEDSSSAHDSSSSDASPHGTFVCDLVIMCTTLNPL